MATNRQSTRFVLLTALYVDPSQTNHMNNNEGGILSYALFGWRPKRLFYKPKRLVAIAAKGRAIRSLCPRASCCGLWSVDCSSCKSFLAKGSSPLTLSTFRFSVGVTLNIGESSHVGIRSWSTFYRRHHKCSPCVKYQGTTKRM